jgi:hypothetical protein
MYKFYVVYHDEIPELYLPEESAGCLYVTNILTGRAIWFENFNKEWFPSLFPYSHIKNDSDFEEVDEDWDNGYISVWTALRDIEEGEISC